MSCLLFMNKKPSTHAHNRPLAVVVTVLVHDGKLLLIRRRRGDYVNLWGLPGGKIEEGEHLSEAACREIAEESGISASWSRYLGVVSEHLVEDGRIARHFLLHICELTPRTTAILTDGEGTLLWHETGDLDSMKGEIIPSDFQIIEKMIGKDGFSYFNCVLEKTGSGYSLRSFTPVRGDGSPQKAEVP